MNAPEGASLPGRATNAAVKGARGLIAGSAAVGLTAGGPFGALVGGILGLAVMSAIGFGVVAALKKGGKTG